MSFESMAGRHLMIGFQGRRMDENLLHLFRETHALGLIVFARNFSTAENLRKLIMDLEEALQRPLLIGVDHEAGRVLHFSEEITFFPDNLAAAQGQTLEETRRQGEIEGSQLRSLGVDICFSPVADLLTEIENPATGNRSYGENPAEVMRRVVARMQGLQAAGVAACGKHFPGLGFAACDPHKSLPVVARDLELLGASELIPFRGLIDAGVKSLMSSHINFPQVDSGQPCVSLSATLATNLLRDELGFEGVLFSDDLDMGAVSALGLVADVAVQSVRAGHDVLLLCAEPDRQIQAARALREAYRSGVLTQDRSEKTKRRIEWLTEDGQPRFQPVSPRCFREAEELAGRTAYNAVQASGQAFAPLTREGSCLVIFPALSELGKFYGLEPELRDEKGFLKGFFSMLSGRPIDSHIMPLSPDGEAVRLVLGKTHNYDQIVFFCYDGAQAGTGWLLEELQKTATDTRVVFLRNPWDERRLRDKSRQLRLFGFRRVQLEAAMNLIFINQRSRAGNVSGETGKSL